MRNLTKLKNAKFTKLLSLTIALIFILSSFVGCGKKTTEDDEASTTKKEKTTVASTAEPTTAIEEPVNCNPLTGETDYPVELIGNRSVLISVENHPQARPQWGITSADIVWEMLAEGGITRMLLMFADASRLPDKIGPVRSARHYFVEIAEGFDSIFVHFGGSNIAYDAMKKRFNTDRIDGMTDNYFYRDRSRNVATEHTAYTTRDDIVEAIKDKEFRTTTDKEHAQPFKFRAKKRYLPQGSCIGVTVPFSSSYTYEYTYNKEENVYYSSLNGNKFMDDNGTQQNFENIVIMYVPVSSLNDDAGRITFDLFRGTGLYISNGSYQKIKWQKGDYEMMLHFYDRKDRPIYFNQGRTYIALVPTENESLTVISQRQ